MPMKRLKILNLSPFIWTMGKEAGIPSVYNVQRTFVDAGHQVHFVIPNGNPFVPGMMNRGSEKDLFIHTFWLPLRLCWSLAKLQLLTRQRSKLLHRMVSILAILSIYFLFYSLGLVKSLIVAKKIKANVIYGHFFFFIPLAYIVGKIYKVPNIGRVYGVGCYQNILEGTKSQIMRCWYEIIALKTPVDLLIITNDGTRGDMVAKKLGVCPEKVRFWMNGVDKDNYLPEFDNERFKESLNISPDTNIILTVSRLEGWKHVDRIINAMPSICTKNRKVICIVVGDGSQRVKLETLAKKLNVDSSVKFVGAVSHDKVIDFINSADIFISLYDMSNLSNSVFEAMTCGKCVVTLDVGGTNEIIKNFKNGILLTQENLGRLAYVIDMLLNNVELRSRLGTNARKYGLQHFVTWEERGKKEVKAIERLCMGDDLSSG